MFLNEKYSVINHALKSLEREIQRDKPCAKMFLLKREIQRDKPFTKRPKREILQAIPCTKKSETRNTTIPSTNTF